LISKFVLAKRLHSGEEKEEEAEEEEGRPNLQTTKKDSMEGRDDVELETMLN
jgi:hypothetical protein